MGKITFNTLRKYNFIYRIAIYIKEVTIASRTMLW